MGLFEEAFQGNYAELAKNIDPDHGLWRQLQDRCVLGREQIDDCKSPVHVCHYTGYYRKIIILIS